MGLRAPGAPRGHGDMAILKVARLGHPVDSGGTEAGVDAALVAWAGEVNYESRLAPGGIDRRVLEALRAASDDLSP